MVKKLDDEFIGKSDVSGLVFKKVAESENGYIYSVTNESKIYFEIFKKKVVPLCIDFEKKIYSETDFKESYPKTNDFGIWAWTTSDLENAKKKLSEL